MKWVLLLLLFVSTFYAGFVGMRFIDSKFPKSKDLAQKSETNTNPIPTVTLTPTQTSTPTPFSTPTPTNTPTPTHTPVPQPIISSQEIHKLMERFAGQYGVDVNILRHIATCESGFNPLAVNGAYAGLYQFNGTAWKNNRLLMGEDTNIDLRLNAEESIQTAAYLISSGKKYLWPNCYP